jgi:pimeloyl-ACP methyl ester carboxylesterase
MRPRPTVVLVHGGPGGYDHSYFEPAFSAQTTRAQVVYVDLRDHGRSARHDPAAWTFEACADDVRALCEHLGIDRPIVFGHSMGGIVAFLYGARHPDHPGALVLQSTTARFDLERLVAGVERAAGAEVGRHGMELLRRVDVVAELPRIARPTLVGGGAVDTVTPVEAAEETMAGLRPGVGTSERPPACGHVPWLDDPGAS